jgi:intein/homing endonuclease
VYNLVTKRAAAYQDSVMEWIDGNIGCLTGDTQIFTNPKGPTAIKDIAPGDMVYAYDLAELAPVKRRVIALKDSGIQHVYKVRTKNHREIKATANHPFLVLNPASPQGTADLVWKMLSDIRPGDRIGVVRGLPDDGKTRSLSDYRYSGHLRGRVKTAVRLPVETDEALLWLLGAYVGDGYMERNAAGSKSRVYFAIPPNDPARSRLEETLKDVFGVSGRQKGPVALAVSSTVLSDFLRWLGMEGTARTKRIPGWIWGLPVSQRLAFIEGFLDTDGHVREASSRDGVQYGQITFVSVNEELLGDVRLLAITCGLNPGKTSKYVKERKLTLGKEWKEYVSYSLTMNLRENLEAIRSHRPPSQGLEFTPVREIVPLLAEPTYDIEVEGVHNFVANGLLVHNSKVTMKYPSIYLLGKGARGEVLSVAFAGPGMHTDAGGKAIHAAPYTSSVITSKSVSKGGGRTGYRGLIRVEPEAHHAKSIVRCDALILDERSRSDTYPYVEVEEQTAQLGHEATVSRVGEDQLFYLMSRGLTEAEATAMVVNGFIEPITRELPMEYAVELNRLIELQMEGAIG